MNSGSKVDIAIVGGELAFSGPVLLGTCVHEDLDAAEEFVDCLAVPLVRLQTCCRAGGPAGLFCGFSLLKALPNAKIQVNATRCVAFIMSYHPANREFGRLL